MKDKEILENNPVYKENILIYKKNLKKHFIRRCILIGVLAIIAYIINPYTLASIANFFDNNISADEGINKVWLYVPLGIWFVYSGIIFIDRYNGKCIIKQIIIINKNVISYDSVDSYTATDINNYKYMVINEIVYKEIEIGKPCYMIIQGNCICEICSGEVE